MDLELNIELTSKQKHLLAICKKHKTINLIQIRNIYNSSRSARNAIEKLSKLGFVSGSFGIWNITQKGMDYS